jgi:cytochrome b involved in lipid metabolism
MYTIYITPYITKFNILKMRKLTAIIFSFLTLSLFASRIYAYTIGEVEQHSTEGDCWMVFEGSVYDLSEYVPDHDRYMDIREWCGRDMTEDFKDKAGIGRDHRESSYVLLERYKIGEIEEEVIEEEEIYVEEATVEDSVEPIKKPREYNLIVPFLISIITYWGLYFLFKKNKFIGISIVKFNAFWNTILFLTLLIPALGFGIFMVIRTKKPQLWDVDFDFLYWHVELSMVMGILGISHFIQRLGIYFSQLKRKKV